MGQNELNEHLGALQNELAKTETDNDEAQNALDTLTDSLENILEHPGEASFDHHRMLMENLTTAVEHFEISHPRLTGMINNVINTLNGLGI